VRRADRHRHNKWALANADDTMKFIQQMLGVANLWHNDNGSSPRVESRRPGRRWMPRRNW